MAAIIVIRAAFSIDTLGGSVVTAIISGIHRGPAKTIQARGAVLTFAVIYAGEGRRCGNDAAH